MELALIIFSTHIYQNTVNIALEPVYKFWVLGYQIYCKFRKFCEGFIFTKLRIFEITMSFTDVDKLVSSCEFSTSQICL